jgi:hypothetical protein
LGHWHRPCHLVGSGVDRFDLIGPETSDQDAAAVGVIARPCGMMPTSILVVTSSVAVLMTETTESPSLLA